VVNYAAMIRRICILLLASLCVHVAARGETPPADALYVRTAAAETNAVKFLLAQISRDGSVDGEFDARNPRYGGKTALCVYALLVSGVDHHHKDIQRAMDWLLKAKLTGTYAVAMRACALAEVRDEKDAKVQAALQADVKWLLQAAASNGAYTYTSYDGKTVGEYDNSNAQLAVLGVWSGARRGVEIPPQYWQLVEKFWLTQQQPDGGWGYFSRPGPDRTKTYGSMTAAGLATLFITFDALHREEFLRCTAGTDNKPLADGMKWLQQDFAIDQNPRLGENRYYYWLYTLSRVGLASGYKQFAGVDWYANGAAELVRRQNSDGSWDFGEERVASTAFATLFIVRGRDPVVMNKLSYKGQWNPRPRDLANLTAWMSQNLEHALKWQIVDIDAPMESWHDSPILYISGAGPVEFTPQQIDKLRLFVLQGGTIVSEAACSNADFSLDMKKLYKKLFDRYELVRLDDAHPLYSLHGEVKDKPGLMGVSNGVRLLAVHCPQELSLGLQMGPAKANLPQYELATNMFLYLTDRASYRLPGQTPWPAARPFKPRATIHLTPVAFEGNACPEPLAWKRLAVLIGNRHQVKLEIDEPLDIAKLDPKANPVTLFSGEGSFDLSPQQTAALKKYLAGGGRMLIEAAGGSRAFDQSVQKYFTGLFGDAQLSRLVPSHQFFQGPPEHVEKVTYRSDYAATLGDDRNTARVYVAAKDNTIGIMYFPDDLTMGLLGANVYHLRGYSQQSAVDLATNALWYLAGLKK